MGPEAYFSKFCDLMRCLKSTLARLFWAFHFQLGAVYFAYKSLNILSFKTIPRKTAGILRKRLVSRKKCIIRSLIATRRLSVFGGGLILAIPISEPYWGWFHTYSHFFQAFVCSSSRNCKSNNYNINKNTNLTGLSIAFKEKSIVHGTSGSGQVGWIRVQAACGKQRTLGPRRAASGKGKPKEVSKEVWGNCESRSSHS